MQIAPATAVQLCPKGSRPSRSVSLGEPVEDPLLLFSVLYGFWVANYVAFNGDVMRNLAAQFLTLAEKQGRRRRSW